MLDSVPPKAVRATAALQPGHSNKKGQRRATYRAYRRYRVIGRITALLGAVCGLVLVGYSLVPAILAGEWVPRTTYAIAALSVALMAGLPYAFARWRWTRLKDRLNED
jgi:hypothetical protein